MGGRIVQLVQGEKLKLSFDDFDYWIERFSKYPLVQLIDLDAAMRLGENRALIEMICKRLPCQVGGGLRTAEDGRRLLDAGAKRVIYGSSLFGPEVEMESSVETHVSESRHGAPGSVAGTTPRSVAGTTPRSVAGTTPRSVDGTMPRSVDGTTPGSVDGTTPGSVTGTTLGSVAGTMPGLVGGKKRRHPVIRLEFAEGLKKALGEEALCFSVDTKQGKVAVKGWTDSVDLTPEEAITWLEDYCGAFLYTHVDTEGTMQGFPVEVAAILRSTTARQLIVAGGIRERAEVDALDAMGVDAVAGMAVYSGAMEA